MRIVRAGLRAFVLPLVRPLATAHGPIAERAGWLVTLEDEAGRFGTGEATPLPAFGGEPSAVCREALSGALRGLADGAERTLDEHLTQVAGLAAATPVARAALEAALGDLAAQRAGLSLAGWIRRRAGLPGEPAARVRAQALVSGESPEAVLASARRAREAGFEVFKLKLAVDPGHRDVAADLDRVAALRAALGPAARIRLDANEAWSLGEAEAALLRLAPFRIEFIEQPVPRHALDALEALDRAGPIPIAADEALLEGRLEACLAHRNPRIFIVKPAVQGGITPTLELATRARAAGIRLVYSNLIEGRVGRELALALAAGLAGGEGDASARGGEEEVHGLGTAALLARDFEAAAVGSPCDEAGRASPGGRRGEPASSSVLVPYAGVGLGVSPGPCWALAGPLYGELHELESPSTGVRPGHPARAGAAGRAADSPLRSTHWLERFVPLHAPRDALVFEGRSFRYRELAEAARTAGEQLAACGLAAGSLVAVLAPPSPEGVVLIHALLERGIVLLPLNTRLSEPELADALAATRSTALLVAASIDRALAERLAERAGCPLLVLGARPERAGLAVVIERHGSPATAEPQDEPRAARLREAHAALVLLTSGTSGRPKAAVLTRENLSASAEASAHLLGQSVEDRWLLCMPLFHIAGLSILVRAALSGACVELEPRFDAERVAHALDTRGISHVSFVATTLAQVLDARAGRRAPDALRLVLVGGGPAPESLLARAVAAGYPIAPTYGLTEAASQVATRPPAPSRDLAGGLVPLPGVELRIVDAAGRAVGAGVEGEIEVRGPTVMRGYLDDPESTARALRGGWLATGDVGCLDEAGRLRVLDRRADLILSGGENVYPAEVESVLAAHPDVAEAGVVGVADARYGARPLAFVVWRAGAVRDVDALVAWCRARLAGYKVPVDFVAAESLPRNASGKLLRRELVERAAGPSGTA